jgi:uncharacterized sporulation protein YeaH/YhbH (DUF444 family)
MHIVDRRLNPKSKSLGNRQRFIRRAKAEIKEAVNRAIKKRKVSSIDGKEEIRLPAKSVREPTFRSAARPGGAISSCPATSQFTVGDRIPKPKPQAAARARTAPRMARARTISSSP